MRRARAHATSTQRASAGHTTHRRHSFKYHHGQSNVLGAMLRTAQRVQRDGQYERAPTRPQEAGPTQLGSNACCSYFTPSSAAGSHLTANASGRSSTKYAATDRHRLVRLQVSREAAACSHRATLMLGAATATSRAPNIFKTPRHDRIRPETHQSLATQLVRRPATTVPTAQCASLVRSARLYNLSFREGNAAHTDDRRPEAAHYSRDSQPPSWQFRAPA